MEGSSDQINDAQISNGIKDPMCLVDIPMPSANESQSDTTTSKDGILTSNTNSIEQSPGEIGISSTEKSQNDMQRQFNLISAPPPPPPEHEHEPKSTFSSNIVITTQRTVNIPNYFHKKYPCKIVQRYSASGRVSWVKVFHYLHQVNVYSYFS